MSNASVVESAFNTVATEFSKAFATPVTVNITVSWGSVGYHSLASGDIAASVENLSGAYSYASFVTDMKANLPWNPGDAVFSAAVKSLPTSDPTKLNKYYIPYAEAKALGLIAPLRTATDGYVGFKSGIAYDFNPADGIASGAYDFQALAAHEIEEVLGRTTGLPASGSATWASPLDALRYSALGVHSFSTTAAAYFSVDGGKTDLGNYNTLGGGDRGDWLSSVSPGDAARAYFNTGAVYSLSADDLTALNALGWGNFTPAPFGLISSSTIAQSPVGSAMGAVPEPSAWALMLTGFGFLGVKSRRRRAALARL